MVRSALVGLPDDGRVRTTGPLPLVSADAGLLERVLANLLGNALRHTDGGVDVSGAAVGHRVRVCVADHGRGVPPELRHRMFEPFQRLGDSASGDGVGLGLAVARGLAEAQGGTLDATETPGGGLTMVVELGAAG